MQSIVMFATCIFPQHTSALWMSAHQYTLALWMSAQHYWISFKGTLSGLRQFWAAESPLKMTKNAFYFMSKALLVLKIFKFLS